MRHILSILCERAIIDKETNLVSYLTVIEGIRVSRLPFRIPFLAFSTLWRSEGDDGGSLELKLTMVNPDGSEDEIFSSYKVQSSAKRHRTNMILNGFEFNQSGTYSLRLERRNGNKWELVTEMPFDITVAVPKQEMGKKTELPESAKPAPKKPVRRVAKK